jgi:hypothetical protein
MIYIPSLDAQQPQQPQQWWLERWSSEIATALALLILLCGLLSTLHRIGIGLHLARNSSIIVIIGHIDHRSTFFCDILITCTWSRKIC